MLSSKRRLDLLLANGRLIPPVFQRLWSLEQSLCKCSLQDPTKSCHSPVAHPTETRDNNSVRQHQSTGSENCDVTHELDELVKLYRSDSIRVHFCHHLLLDRKSVV